VSSRLAGGIASALLGLAVVGVGVAAIGSARADESQDELAAVYWSILCREPDAEGLRTWTEAGLSAEEARDALLGSEEGRWVAAVRAEYLSLLGRDPIPGDCGGLHSWARGSPRLTEIRRAILENQEYRASIGPEATVLARFEPAPRQLPEDIAAGADGIYASIWSAEQIWRVGFDGRSSPYAQLPSGRPGMSATVGLHLEPSGELFVVYRSGTPEVPSGVYRVPTGGGNARLYAWTDQAGWPNDLVLDRAGNVYMTDSVGGAVFQAGPAGGEMERWMQHPLLASDLGACPPAHYASALGANGIVLTSAGDLLVANSTKATVVRVPVNADGSAGTPQLYAGPDCSRLKGADGMALDAAGNLYVASNSIHRIVRIAPGGEVTVLESGGLLDFPSALALGSGPNARRLYVVNFGLLSTLLTGWPSRPAILIKDVAG